MRMHDGRYMWELFLPGHTHCLYSATVFDDTAPVGVSEAASETRHLVCARHLVDRPFLMLNGSSTVYQCGKLPNVPPSTPNLSDVCELHADGCMCSAGCQSTFACTPSAFCNGKRVGAAQLGGSNGVVILLFLHFNRSWVRMKHVRSPWMAFNREVNRIAWLLRSARAVNTTLPVHVVVARGSYNASTEARFKQLGASSIIESPTVSPPRWTSTFHKHSFSRIGALALTQFRRVIVLDNDMTLIANIDELAHAETPAMVFHTATVLPRKERSAPTGGLFVLRPSQREFDRAIAHLYALNAPTPRDRGRAARCYDGSDQEFWRSFYRPLFELPLRFHAHTGLIMNMTEWRKVRLMHNIHGFVREDAANLEPQRAQKAVDSSSSLPLFTTLPRSHRSACMCVRRVCSVLFTCVYLQLRGKACASSAATLTMRRRCRPITRCELARMACRVRSAGHIVRRVERPPCRRRSCVVHHNTA